NTEAGVREQRVAEHGPSDKAKTSVHADAWAAVERDRVAFAGIFAADDAADALGLDKDAVAVIRDRFGATGIGADAVTLDDRPRSSVGQVDADVVARNDVAGPRLRTADDRAGRRVACRNAKIPAQ